MKTLDIIRWSILAVIGAGTIFIVINLPPDLFQ